MRPQVGHTQLAFVVAVLASLAVAEGKDESRHTTGLWPVALDKHTVFIQATNRDKDVILKDKNVKKDDFEPSGMTVFKGWLYIVSDNGKIGRQRLGKNGGALQIQDLNFRPDIKQERKLGDFESIATVPGDPYLYLGVEGDGSDVRRPRIVRYVPPSDTVDLNSYATVVKETNKSEEQEEEAAKKRATEAAETALDGFYWELEELKEGGMEAMTFIPNGFHPYDDEVKKIQNRAFDGIFLVSTQMRTDDPGKNAKGKNLKSYYDTYAYVLKKAENDQKKGEATYLGRLPDIKRINDNADYDQHAMSDMFFSPETDSLFVLYDEGARTLQELVWSPPNPQAMTAGAYHERRYVSVRFQDRDSNQMQGVEAVALTPQGDLYMGLDQADRQACENGNCIDGCSSDEKGCKGNNGWHNYVYCYEVYSKEVFPTGLPDISGMVLIGQDATSARYLLVRDTKSHKPGARLMILTVTPDGKETLEPVAVGWKDPDGRPSDLEGVCKVSGTDNRYLLLESSYWTGEDGKLLPPRFGRIFYIELGGAPSNWTAEVKSVRHLNATVQFENRQGGRFPKENYEGIVCLDYDSTNDIAFILIADRQAPNPGRNAFEITLDLKGDEANDKMMYRELASDKINLTSPLGDGPNVRRCSDLYLESVTETRTRIWASSAFDPDLDGGPFQSTVYVAGEFLVDRWDPREPGANNLQIVKSQFLFGVSHRYVPARAENRVYPTLGGIKVEAVAKSPNFWEDPMKPTLRSRISIGTDDEHFGGIWRPLLMNGADQ